MNNQNLFKLSNGCKILLNQLCAALYSPKNVLIKQVAFPEKCTHLMRPSLLTFNSFLIDNKIMSFNRNWLIIINDPMELSFSCKDIGFDVGYVCRSFFLKGERVFVSQKYAFVLRNGKAKILKDHSIKDILFIKDGAIYYFEEVSGGLFTTSTLNLMCSRKGREELVIKSCFSATCVYENNFNSVLLYDAFSTLAYNRVFEFDYKTLALTADDFKWPLTLGYFEDGAFFYTKQTRINVNLNLKSVAWIGAKDHHIVKIEEKDDFEELRAPETHLLPAKTPTPPPAATISEIERLLADSPPSKTNAWASESPSSSNSAVRRASLSINHLINSAVMPKTEKQQETPTVLDILALLNVS